MASDQRDGAVVTGAASRIGRAIAAGLAKDGFSVVVADLDEANGRAAAKEIAAANQGRAIFQRVDMTDRRSVSADPQLSAGVERRAEPGRLAGDPAQSQTGAVSLDPVRWVSFPIGARTRARGASLADSPLPSMSICPCRLGVNRVG